MAIYDKLQYGDTKSLHKYKYFKWVLSGRWNQGSGNTGSTATYMEWDELGLGFNNNAVCYGPSYWTFDSYELVGDDWTSDRNPTMLLGGSWGGEYTKYDAKNFTSLTIFFHTTSGEDILPTSVGLYSSSNQSAYESSTPLHFILYGLNESTNEYEQLIDIGAVNVNKGNTQLTTINSGFTYHYDVINLNRLVFQGWNGYISAPPYQPIKLVGSTSTPVYFALSNGNTYTVTGEQDINLYKGDSITISAHSPQGKTFSLQGLEYCNVSNVTWNHKSYTGSYVTANAVLTGFNSNTLYLGLSNEREKQYSAYCVWPSSTNQAACSNYQPGIYVSAISSNCHSNGYWHDNDCTDFEQLTSASKGTCNRGGNGTKGWTTYDGGVSNVYIAESIFGWNKVQHWSANMNMKNITAAAASPTYIFWGNTSAGNTTPQRMYGSGTYTRGSTKTANIERNGLTGAGCPYCIENQNARPINHYGWYTLTANMR